MLCFYTSVSSNDLRIIEYANFSIEKLNHPMVFQGKMSAMVCECDNSQRKFVN